MLDALRHALAGGAAVLVSTPGPCHPGLPGEVPLRVALVVETSGSTGSPKRVAIGADALLANAAASESALGGPGQWVLALPTHYIAGLNVLARSIAADTEPVVGARRTLQRGRVRRGRPTGSPCPSATPRSSRRSSRPCSMTRPPAR